MVENSDSADSCEDGWVQDDTDSNDIVYLNNAGQAPLSAEVKKAGMDALRCPPWKMHVEEDQKKVRELFASLIEADAKDIAIMPSTAFATTFAARNIQRCRQKKKGRILILQDQMCSAIYPWQQICSESNGDLTLDIVPHPTSSEGGWTESIIKRLNHDNVAVACLPPLHWSDGALIDLESISALCVERRIVLIVDATQGRFNGSGVNSTFYFVV